MEFAGLTFLMATPRKKFWTTLETGLRQAKRTGQNVYVFPTAEGMKLGKQPPPFRLQHYIAKPDGSYEYVEPVIPKTEVTPGVGKAKDLYWYTISELKSMCRDRGLSDSGTKGDLVRRLQ